MLVLETEKLHLTYPPYRVTYSEFLFFSKGKKRCLVHVFICLIRSCVCVCVTFSSIWKGLLKGVGYRVGG